MSASRRRPDTAIESYGPETLRLLALAYESAIKSLPEVEGQTELRIELARRILALAGLGEADPVRLRDSALKDLQERLRGARAPKQGSED